jgi:hypothetical protein
MGEVSILLSSDIPSFPTMSCPAIPSAAPEPAPAAAPAPFTAARAHSLAIKKAASECASAKPVPCTFCNGTGKASITVETFGEANSAHAVSLPCCYCKDGTINRQIELYNSYIWCQSPEAHYASSVMCARDGVKVFGNTTYLCRACGFVTQFG